MAALGRAAPRIRYTHATHSDPTGEWWRHACKIQLNRDLARGEAPHASLATLDPAVLVARLDRLAHRTSRVRNSMRRSTPSAKTSTSCAFSFAVLHRCRLNSTSWSERWRDCRVRIARTP